jgi:hypothetical protein
LFLEGILLKSSCLIVKKKGFFYNKKKKIAKRETAIYSLSGIKRGTD